MLGAQQMIVLVKIIEAIFLLVCWRCYIYPVLLFLELLYLMSIQQFRIFYFQFLQFSFDFQKQQLYLNIQNIFEHMQLTGDSNFKFYLSKKQKLQAQKAFKIFDQDGSGQISIREFDQILKSIGQNLSEQQLQQIIQKIDKDGNGFIDFQQFLELVSPKMIMNRSEKAYVQAYKIIDDNDDGFLDKQQLKRANIITGAGLSDEDIDAIMKYVQVKFNGKFTFNQILKMLFRKPLDYHLS